MCAIAIDWVAWSVGLSVCLSDCLVFRVRRPGKTTESGLTQIGPRNHVLDDVQIRQIHSQSSGWPVGDADFCQNSLTTCLTSAYCWCTVERDVKSKKHYSHGQDTVEDIRLRPRCRHLANSRKKRVVFDFGLFPLQGAQLSPRDPRDALYQLKCCPICTVIQKRTTQITKLFLASTE